MGGDLKITNLRAYGTSEQCSVSVFGSSRSRLDRGGVPSVRDSLFRRGNTRNGVRSVQRSWWDVGGVSLSKSVSESGWFQQERVESEISIPDLIGGGQRVRESDGV